MIESVTNVFLQPNKRETTVYKIFNKIKDNYLSLKSNSKKDTNDYFKFNPPGEWISCYIDSNGEEWPNMDIDNGKVIYPRGFHSYILLPDAVKIYYSKYYSEHSVLCECRSKFRLIEGTEKFIFDGKELETRVIVSRGIKIVRELKKYETN